MNEHWICQMLHSVVFQEDLFPSLQPRPQGFSLKKWDEVAITAQHFHDQLQTFSAP